MIRGTVMAIGDLTVDGDKMTGVFIQTTEKDLSENAPRIYHDVEIKGINE